MRQRLMLVLACSLAALLAACASTTPAKFSLTGSRIIACCCPTPCPCRLNRKPMNCHGCDHTDAVHIEKGSIGDTRMDGVNYVIVGRGFGQDVGTNWTYVYVSDQASEAQYQALGNWLGATVSGFGPKAPYLVGKFVGMRRAPVSYVISADRKQHDCAIPGILELKTHAITNPGRPEPVVSTGILDAFGDRFVHADCLAHTLDDPTIQYKWDLTGRQCNQADFSLDSARAAKGGIGWGCWSAHVDLGDATPYAEELIGHDGRK